MLTMVVPDDPFDAEAWEAAFEQTCAAPLPPHAYKDPERWAVEELVASVEAADAPEPTWANVPDHVLGLE